VKRSGPKDYDFDRIIIPGSIDRPILSLVSKKGRNRIDEADPTQVGSCGDPRMSRLLHPAACDYPVAMPRESGSNEPFELHQVFLGPLGFDFAQHRQTLRPSLDGIRSKAPRPFGVQ